MLYFTDLTQMLMQTKNNPYKLQNNTNAEINFKSTKINIWKVKKTPKPITWEIKTKKIGFNTYEIHIIAFISYPWWIHSQESTPDGIFHTVIKFEENSYLSLIGKPKEIGALKEVYDETSKARILFYSSAVIFVQEIISYRKPESLTVKIIYTACRDNGCLKPQEMEFKIELT